MKLTEIGSLVLFDKNNTTVWDSGKGPKDQSLSATLDPVAVALFAAFVTISFFILLIRINLHSEHDKDEDDFGLVAGLPTRFLFEDLKVATNNFCRKLGHGGFGSVFEGTLNGQRVAVKRLDGAGQGIKEFLAEVMTIGSIHHINLVRLIGFCSEKSSRLLVYEYMSKGSLDKWIFHKNQGVALDWETRCNIIIGVAKGLAYLHEDCRQRIAHLDIKPQNILLDDKFQVKISDFGLSMLIDRERSHVSTTTRGTRGYMAPEWLRSRITEKADVYSFGIVVMEILCSRKNLDYSQPKECVHLISMLENMVHENRLLELVDDHSNDVHLHGNEVIAMMNLAMWCLQIDSSRRPSMSVVVKVLEGYANVETNIDYNFTNPTLQALQDADNLGISPPPLASILSIGR